jgi:hypothetical protein
MISVNFDNRSFNSVDNNIALRLTKYISDWKISFYARQTSLTFRKTSFK